MGVFRVVVIIFNGNLLLFSVKCVIRFVFISNKVLYRVESGSNRWFFEFSVKCSKWGIINLIKLIIFFSVMEVLISNVIVRMSC